MAIVHALDRILNNCTSITSLDMCNRTSIIGTDLYLVMTEFPFEGFTGRVGFAGVNRIFGSFDIFQFGPAAEMRSIGKFQQQGSGLTLNQSALAFRSNQDSTSGNSLREPALFLLKQTIALETGAELSTGIGGFVITLSLIIIIASLLFMVFFYRHRQDRNIKRSSPLFNQLILTGIIFVAIGLIIWTPEQSQATCIVKVWLSVIGFGLIMSSILVKTYRINKIFHTLKVRYISLSDLELIKFGLPLLIVELVLLIIYTFADGLPHPELVVGRSPQIFSYTICTTTNETFQGVLTGLIMSYNFLLVLIAAVLAYKVRHVVREYNESAHIAYLVSKPELR